MNQICGYLNTIAQQTDVVSRFDGTNALGGAHLASSHGLPFDMLYIKYSRRFYLFVMTTGENRQEEVAAAAAPPPRWARYCKLTTVSRILLAL